MTYRYRQSESLRIGDLLKICALTTISRAYPD
jgi:hypothetical protein